MPSLALDTPELAETYDAVSDKQFDHGKILLTALALRSGERVLDIGCGTGRLGEYAARNLVGPTGRVVGIDPLPHRIAIARRRAAPNHRAEVGVSDDLGAFPDGSFDAAYLNSVYHWLPEKLPTLREARRVLAHGGRIGISVASRERPHDVQVILDEVLRAHGLAPHLAGSTPHKVTAAELATQLEESGFHIDEIRIHTFVDTFADTRAVLAFTASSAFGNFLAEHAPETRTRVIDDFSGILARKATPTGIILRRRLLFAVATAA